MLTKAIALDHAHLGVLCPGFFDTRTMYRITKCWAAKANSNESLTSFQPTIGRPIETREIAEPMAFLPSDASSAMTGSAMIDGGVLAKARRGEQKPTWREHDTVGNPG